jgi:hypothetical protein
MKLNKKNGSAILNGQKPTKLISIGQAQTNLTARPRFNPLSEADYVCAGLYYIEQYLLSGRI